MDYENIIRSLNVEIKKLRRSVAPFLFRAKKLHANASMPPSKCIGRKKITNNREKTGKKPGGQ
ncbi:MAG: hypothetical protein K2N87_20290 [Eubacterium sp.]|nr:hypothetical protein [Eubacterium sp.]